MPKDVTPPPAAPRYEGFRWLGSQWGRSGKPTPSKVSGALMLAAAIVVCIVAINAVRDDSKPGAVVLILAVGTACLIAAGFYFVEAHFAGRAAAEQEPLEQEPLEQEPLEQQPTEPEPPASPASDS